VTLQRGARLVMLPHPPRPGLYAADCLTRDVGHEFGWMVSTGLFQDFSAPLFPKNKAVKSHYGESCTSAHRSGKRRRVWGIKIPASDFTVEVRMDSGNSGLWSRVFLDRLNELNRSSRKKVNAMQCSNAKGAAAL
jgi:hypothetical protein